MILFQLIAGLFFLILIHELGHFIAAKLVGIEIEEFGIGFPPRITELFTYKGTKFTLNWIPLGGFVRPKGENDPEIKGGLAAAPPFSRLFVLIAGPVMNLAAGVIIFAIIFARIGEPVFEQVVIVGVAPNSPAETSGILVDDVFVSINNVEIDTFLSLIDVVQANLDRPLEIILLRNEQEITIYSTPSSLRNVDEGALGIQMGMVMASSTVPITTSEALTKGVDAVYLNIQAILSLPGKMFSGSAQSEEVRVIGYKGMYNMLENLNERDQTAPEYLSGINTLSLFGAITVSLGLFNLFPFPALDGGRILFIIPEVLFKKRLPAHYENVVHLVGFAFLILVMIYVNVQDFVNPVSIP